MTVMHQLESLSTTSTDWVVEDEPAGTFRVNRTALTDEAIFHDEMRSIFNRCWLYVGHESEIPKPGDFRARDVGNRPLVFWHGHDGVKRVFYNTCRHRGALVCRVPQGNSKTMNCFYHAWTYGSTGALNGLPGEEGYGPTFDRANMSLQSPAKVDSYRGFVFACFDPEALDLRTYLAGAADYLDLVADQAQAMEIAPGAHEYSADANWKLYVENSVDGYHVLPLHVTYFEYLEQTEGNKPALSDFSQSSDLGNGHAVIKFRGPWARPVARWTSALGEGNRERLQAIYAELVRKYGPERAELIGLTDRIVLIFPNLIILDIMGVVVRSITPTSPDTRRSRNGRWPVRERIRICERGDSITSSPSRVRADSRRLMTSRHSRLARPACAPRAACRGRTSPAAYTASAPASPAAATTNCKCAHSGGGGRL